MHVPAALRLYRQAYRLVSRYGNRHETRRTNSFGDKKASRFVALHMPVICPLEVEKIDRDQAEVVGVLPTQKEEVRKAERRQIAPSTSTRSNGKRPYNS